MMKTEPYPNLSLFVADFLSWNPKGERHTMEHPFFSLSKNKDTKPRQYESPDGKAQLTVMPSGYGMPTIWDKDLLIYTATLIREAMNRGSLGSENKAIRIDTANFMEATVKGDGTQQRKGLMATLDRLKGCTVKTSIETDGTSYTKAFSLFDSYEIAVKTKTGKVAALDIKVCDWLYGAIWNAEQEMLSISRDYFRLEGGIERRLYELARKHCGNQPFWKVGVETLWIKSGSTAALKEFRRKIFKGQVDLGTLPDYRVQLKPEIDQVWFFSKHYKEPIQAVLGANE
ncbi:MAG: replication initiator protein A [Betaproteobacteria bacterium]|nr:replication initiator protein A [Betaproteobacteria bacterium]